MHACIAAARQLANVGDTSELAQIRWQHGSFELEPARRDAERRHQAQAALDLGLIVAPYQEAPRVGAVVPFAKEPCRAPRAQKRDERIAELTAAMQLQRQVEP